MEINKEPNLVAEIGCNHKGETKIAKEMIEIVKYFCKVRYVKFQKRNVKELLTKEEYNKPHPNPIHSYGDTYGAHREYLEFSLGQHKEIQSYCKDLRLEYLCSVQDLTSAKEITSLNPDFIKIPSAMNTHFTMLEWICENYKRKIQLSVGMTTKKELDNIINFFIKRKRNKDLILFICTSGYLVPFKDLALLEISKLKDKYGKIVQDIGFSGHHLGIAVDIAAYTLGATWIERHFTLDRTWKGTDHTASLEPDGLRRLARDLKAAKESLTYKEDDILEIEKFQRNKLKFKEGK